MDHVLLDAVDAVELIEILDYVIESIDRIARYDMQVRVAAGLEPYKLRDLRTDLVRLRLSLEQSPRTS